MCKMLFVFEILFVLIFLQKKKKKIHRNLHKELAWKFYPFCTHNTEAVCTLYWKWNFTRGWRAPTGRTASDPLFLREFYFFSPGWSASREKKTWRTQKSTFAWTGRQIDDCADRFSRRAPNRSISQSVSQFVQRWASGTVKIVPSLVFAPRGSLWRQCNLPTAVCIATGKKGIRACAHTRVPCPGTTRR